MIWEKKNIGPSFILMKSSCKEEIEAVQIRCNWNIDSSYWDWSLSEAELGGGFRMQQAWLCFLQCKFRFQIYLNPRIGNSSCCFVCQKNMDSDIAVTKRSTWDLLVSKWLEGPQTSSFIYILNFWFFYIFSTFDLISWSETPT